METSQIIAILATAIATSTPLVFGAIGETIAERSGTINLSAEGTMLMGAMTGFAIAKTTNSNSVLLGFLAPGCVGGAIAFIVAFGSLTLKQSQIAIGFVLALLFSDLSSFLGHKFVRIPGPTVPSFPLPILQQIPFFGQVCFKQIYWFISVIF